MSEPVQRVLDKSIEVLDERENVVRIRVVVKTERPQEGLRVEGSDLVYETPEPNVAGRPNAALKRYFMRLLGVSERQVDVERWKEDVKYVVVRGKSVEEIREVVSREVMFKP